jgi:hypothetical protein
MAKIANEDIRYCHAGAVCCMYRYLGSSDANFGLYTLVLCEYEGIETDSFRFVMLG